MVRRAARVDENHGEIRDAFRAAGCLAESLAAMGRGVPDLLVCRGATVALVEVKTRKGKLTEDQLEWMSRGWPVFIAREVADVPRIITAMRQRRWSRHV